MRSQPAEGSVHVLVEPQPEESHGQIAVTVTPEACWHADRYGPFSVRPQAAIVGASCFMEELARVAGGFVVDWELGGPTREQQ